MQKSKGVFRSALILNGLAAAFLVVWFYQRQQDEERVIHRREEFLCPAKELRVERNRHQSLSAWLLQTPGES
jgi:hypothetical protein